MKFLILVFFFVPYLTSGQLSTLLLETLKKNPGLITTLQSNPELLKSVLGGAARGPKPQVDQCEPLRKQNKVLKQMVLAVTGSDPTSAAASDLFITEKLPRNQRILDPTQALLQKVAAVQQQQPAEPSISLKSILITPSATWTTSMTTTSYVTTVTHTETSEVPIILRGQRVIHESFFMIESAKLRLSSRWRQEMHFIGFKSPFLMSYFAFKTSYQAGFSRCQ